MDTTNILFILGGAFDSIEKIIENRVGKGSIGFGSEIKETNKSMDKVLSQLETEDLLKYGLIPEFVGRLPVTVTLEELNEDALVQILTEPKNALVKQYQSLLAMDDVELEFEEEALREIAKQAIAKKAGARGLRGIIEDTMMNVMFEIPSRDDVRKVIITRESVLQTEDPIVITDNQECVSS